MSFVETVEKLKNTPTNVGTSGFVRLVDVMGEESAIVQAARVSYGAGTTTPSDDRTLIRYLMRHRHCYHPSMQVLTKEGWKKWSECLDQEFFAVPNPITKSIDFEQCQVLKFDSEGYLYTFKSKRMSYAVTAEHRMRFKQKGADNFESVAVKDKSDWGHFDPVAGYTVRSDMLPVSVKEQAAFVGFYLGDGSFASANRVTFHLKKDRKKEYLRQLCQNLNLEVEEKQSATYEDAVVFWVTMPDFLRETLGKSLNCRVKDKGIPRNNWELDSSSWCQGILEGLENSDGSIKKDRPQSTFSSTSAQLTDLYEAVSLCCGNDAHHIKSFKGVGRVTQYPGGSTTLEARKQYHGYLKYEGPVYCATTSTHLLIVRGAEDEFAYLCGNSTPLEMVELKFHIRVPMDTWRQWIRHRTASVNEYSTRYSEAIDDKAKTAPDEWRLQATENKQGSSGVLTEWPEGFNHKGIPFDTPGEYLSAREEGFHEQAHALYHERLELNVAREVARKDLPLSTYTEAYWKIDLHNLLHFLGLRMDSHAQLEIREFANAIGDIVKVLYPNVWEAFVDYRLEAMFLSKQEVENLRAELEQALYNRRVELPHKLGKREAADFRAKKARLCPPERGDH